jgi:hypothetical protein
MKMTIDAFQRLVSANPEFGLLGSNLSDPSALDRCNAAVEWLAACVRTEEPDESSYVEKHVAEPEIGYASQLEFAVAAAHLGIPVKVAIDRVGPLALIAARSLTAEEFDQRLSTRETEFERACREMGLDEEMQAMFIAEAIDKPAPAHVDVPHHRRHLTLRQRVRQLLEATAAGVERSGEMGVGRTAAAEWANQLLQRTEGLIHER